MAKGTGIRFRELVTFFLQSEGLPAVRKSEPPRKLSERFAADPLESDIQGIENWTILTRSEQERKLSEGVDEAVSAAAHDGAPLAATVWARDGRSVDESFVVLTLAHFVKLIRLQEAAR